jgi:hypothetical protein
MLNYASYSYRNGYIVNKPDTLATINFDQLYYGKLSIVSLDQARGIKPATRAALSGQGGSCVKYRRAGCVINTDKYQGPGKHWMALFVDTTTPTWTVEFFNSSGNNPAPEWVNWMEKTKNILERIISSDSSDSNKRPVVEIIKSSNQQHQWSRSECGLYSLFYIWARLNHLSVEYFALNTIPDQLMFEFRHHLFHDQSRKQLKHFNWDKYQSDVKLEWES